MKTRSPILAGLLGLVLGPIGFIYNGLNIFISSVIYSFIFNFLLRLFFQNSPYYHFENVFILQLPIYAYFAYRIAIVLNIAAAESEFQEFEVSTKSMGYGFAITLCVLRGLVKLFVVGIGIFGVTSHLIEGANFRAFLSAASTLFVVGVVSKLFSIVGIYLMGRLVKPEQAY